MNDSTAGKNRGILSRIPNAPKSNFGTNDLGTVSFEAGNVGNTSSTRLSSTSGPTLKAKYQSYDGDDNTVIENDSQRIPQVIIIQSITFNHSLQPLNFRLTNRFIRRSSSSFLFHHEVQGTMQLLSQILKILYLILDEIAALLGLEVKKINIRIVATVAQLIIMQLAVTAIAI